MDDLCYGFEGEGAGYHKDILQNRGSAQLQVSLYLRFMNDIGRVERYEKYPSTRLERSLDNTATEDRAVAR